MKEENNILGFVKLIIKSSEKKATNDNMTNEQTKDYINRRLYEHFEKTGAKIEEILPIYEEAYTEFSRDDFMQYVIAHTSNTDIIWGEKLKIEKKLEKISSRIAEINKQLGTEENLSEFDLRFMGFQQHKSSINAKIEEVKKKYSLPIEVIKSKRGQTISEEHLQEYSDLIAEMVDSCSSVEELYEMAKEQIGFFDGMGEVYEEELRKKSPELFEYIDSLIKGEVGSVMEEKQKLEDEKSELQKLQSGFLDMCKKYDKRLPEELRGTAQERQQREENERRMQREQEERKAKEEQRRRVEQERIWRREIEEQQRRSEEGGCGGGPGCG